MKCFLYEARTLSAITGLVGFALTLMAGCSGGPAEVGAPDVDPQAAAMRAVELYDGNTDGFVDKDELAKCPPLLSALAAYDANQDGRLASDEITGRLIGLLGSGANLANYECTVTVAGRPLAGAVVRLRPAEFLGDSLPPAEGTTDGEGITRVSIDAAHIPTDLAGAPLVYPGLYLVEITHPTTQLPPRYNTATELGVEVAPSSRTGLAARFNLNPR